MDSIERRSYQESIAKNALRVNTLVCLPTGLGKSIVAAYVAASRLQRFPGKGVVMLAPTKPLVLQHYRTFQKLLKIEADSVVWLTGEVQPDERVGLWKKSLIFSTPQVFMNDLLTGKIVLDSFSLMIFDEAHRAVGDYPYVFIAERYAPTNDSLILGLTASPGSSAQDVRQICDNLRLEWVEARSIQSDDVRPYVGGIEVKWVSVNLPQIFYDVKRELESFLREKLRTIRDHGYLESAAMDRIRLRDVLSARQRILDDAMKGNRDAKMYLAYVYAAVHAIRAIEFLETQGFPALKDHLDGLKEKGSKRMTPGLKMLLEDPRMAKVTGIVDSLVAREVDHPKVTELIKATRLGLSRGVRRVMVFTNYRATAARLVQVLNKVDGVSAVRLVGQASRTKDPGLTQRKQAMVLDDFKSGTFNVLVATQIGEEGLDIVECDEVIFYDTVPSAIRYIQRRGRTGRKGPGEAVILIAKGTRDEAYYWISQRRERQMAGAIRQFVAAQKASVPDQPRIEKFISSNMKEEKVVEQLVVVADSRELGALVTRELAKLGVLVKSETLQVGDFILSDRVVVERKEIDDFASSIIDGRLFQQAANLKNAYSKPIIIVEGESPTGTGRVRPEAMMGAYASILIDYGIPIVWTQKPSETAQLMFAILRREQTQDKRAPRIMTVAKPNTLQQQQEFIISSLPNIDNTRAKKLLTTFHTPQRVFQASKEELMNVSGIGEKISEEVRRVLTTNYKIEAQI
ncbi:MAG TPA: DEAD/DEAH box helicase [Terriglobales bacterium]|nr:DEAD/DEAH box helicase [Terriglobales bacterium]